MIKDKMKDIVLDKVGNIQFIFMKSRMWYFYFRIEKISNQYH